MASALLCVEFDTLSITLRRQHQIICSPLSNVGVCWFFLVEVCLVYACIITKSMLQLM